MASRRLQRLISFALPATIAATWAASGCTDDASTDGGPSLRAADDASADVVASDPDGTLVPEDVTDRKLEAAAPPRECLLAFEDLGTTHPAYAPVRGLFVHGVARGCTDIPLRYCPDDPALRRHAAVMLVRAMGATLSTAQPNAYFDDIEGDTVSAINRLSELGITKGCGTRTFCPNGGLERDHLASMIVRALPGEKNSTASPDAYFDDVAGSIHEGAINRVKELGLLPACGERLFCPNATTTRAELAVVLARAFQIDDAVCGGLKP